MTVKRVCSFASSASMIIDANWQAMQICTGFAFLLLVMDFSLFQGMEFFVDPKNGVL